MEVYIYNIPPSVDTHTLRAHVAALLHSPPVSAKDPSGRPLNFQLWLSQQDSRPPGNRGGGGGGDGGGPSPANRRIYHNRRRGQWPFARLVIPLAQAARDLLAESKIRPITAHGKKLKFVPGTASPSTSTGSSGGKKSKRNHTGVPLDVVRRLLAVPYGGRKSIQLEETAETLRRGRNCHLFELGTINRDGEFAKEHTVYDANTVKMVPSIIPRRKKFTRNDKGEKIIIESTNDDKPTFRPDKVPEARCVLACEAGFRGMQIKILKPDRVMTFRLQPRTIEQICWSPSSLPSPPPSWQPRPKPHVEQNELNEIPEAQDIIIRLSQPLILEKKDTTTNMRHRLSELPSKPHISPYCFNTIFISGYNLVETLESMSKMYGTPIPWELHLQRSSWRRYRLSALRTVEEKMQDMPLALAFQYQKLLSNCVLDPVEILQAIDYIEERFEHDGIGIRIRTLQKLASDDALARTKIESRLQQDFRPIDLKERILIAETHASGSLPMGEIDDESFHEVLSVYITPTALQLYGPNYERSNRILRQYRSKKECFLRVSFCDEDLGNSNFVGPSKGYDMPVFLKSRFGSAMKEGIIIGGRLYEFLAYSQSSLREATVWFMTSFEFDGKLVTAERIRTSLGNFDHIKNCPARYAARMSQAFSATHRGFSIDLRDVKRIPDKEKDGKCFTDGAGKISVELAKEVQENIVSKLNKPRNRASGLQIRIAGCKGMVFVDPALEERKLQIRPSMIKFVGSSLEIEVAEAFCSPKPFNLNRPLIKILEDLGVPFEPILKLQRAMENGVYQGIKSIGSASSWLDRFGFGSAFHAPTIFKMLHKYKLAFGNLPPELAKFLQCSLTYAAIKELRNIKYRSRINLPDCWTLVGGIDESNTLEEGEVFICVKPEKGITAVQYISGPVAVTRSPQMWPGDVRMLRAVGRPPSRFLKAQTNVIMFSAKGKRPEQDKMSGGDLDGDTYNIITQAQADLLPRRTVEPAAYPPAPRKILDRDSTISDIADFVCEYMNNDYMGMVANQWLMTADAAVLGSEDARCQKLAELYSIAVDFPKSGTPVEASKLPKSDSRKKPDFMVKPHDKVTEADTYPSQRYLGRLFRDIQLPHILYSEHGIHPTFANFRFEDLPRANRPNEPPAAVVNYVDLPLKLAKDYLPEFSSELAEQFNARAERMANDFYDHMTFCARAFRIDEEEQLSEEECFLTMVGTPIRSVRRHEQSMRLTLYVTNFLNNLRAELTTYDEGEAEEDVRRALGVAFTLWRLSLSDFEDRQFGCFSLNLIAFEAIVNNVERIQELIELAAEKENDDRFMPHLADAAQAMARREEEEETEDDEGKETLAVIDSIAFVDAEELAGEEFE